VCACPPCSDVEKIREGIGDKLAIFIQWMTTFVVGFIIGFVREWRLTLLLLGITPFIASAVAISSIVSDIIILVVYVYCRNVV
jgi:ABC-type multidrug transport system fused ATPase/permease subunit